jgi:hypothetical protein
MKQIKCSINDLSEFVIELERIENNFNAKKKLFMERLAKIGIDVAKIEFANAKYDGINDVVVGGSPQWVSDNTLAVTAIGDSVAFIEFGAGVFHSEHPKGAELGMIHGTYGKGRGKNKKWGYYDNGGSLSAGGQVKTTKRGTVVITSGNEPTRAMYDAAKTMRENAEQIAREIFAND